VSGDLFQDQRLGEWHDALTCRVCKGANRVDRETQVTSAAARIICTCGACIACHAGGKCPPQVKP
jgi:hypothetical protein